MEGLAAAGGIAPETVLERGSDPDSGGVGVGTRLGRGLMLMSRAGRAVGMRVQRIGWRGWLRDRRQRGGRRLILARAGTGLNWPGRAVTAVVVKTTPHQPRAAATGWKTERTRTEGRGSGSGNLGQDRRRLGRGLRFFG